MTRGSKVTRPRAQEPCTNAARHVRGPDRGHHDRRTPRPRGLVHGNRVVGRVSGDAREGTLDRGDQLEGGGRVIHRRLGQRVGQDHA